MKKEPITIFFAVDDNYVPQLKIAMNSMMEHASKNRRYQIFILHTSLSVKSRKEIRKLKRKGFSINFFNVEAHMENLAKKLNVRDYYTMTTYYRLILPKAFFFINKAIYLDSDIVVRGDIAELYDTELGTNLVGAVPDGSVQIFDEFITYVEKALGVPHDKYFNAGILVMNLKRMRAVHFQEQVEELVKKVSFKVAQDQDLLNVVCKNQVKYLGEEWNKMPLGEKNNDVKLIHYNLILKPWKQDNIPYEEIFWSEAGKIGVAEQLIAFKNSIPEERKEAEKQGIENVKQLCLFETKRRKYYQDGIKVLDTVEKAPRDAVLARIKEYEAAGKWDKDVEQDPPFTPLRPGDVDYKYEKLSTRFKAFFANFYSFRYFNRS